MVQRFNSIHRYRAILFLPQSKEFYLLYPSKKFAGDNVLHDFMNVKGRGNYIAPGILRCVRREQLLALFVLFYPCFTCNKR